MKKTATVLAAIIVVFAALLGNAEMVEGHKLSKKTINLEAKSSRTLNITTKQDSDVVISAKADKGKVHIKVTDSDGKVVKQGFNIVKFKVPHEPKPLIVIFTNKTNKYQKIILAGMGWDEGVAP